MTKHDDLDCDDDVLIDEPIIWPTTPRYRQHRKIEGCTCGKARIVIYWEHIEGEDVWGIGDADDNS